MNATPHTPEPWSRHENLVLKGRVYPDGYEGWPMAKVTAPNDAPGGKIKTGRANAERIVRCVNACAGLTNDEVAALNLSEARKVAGLLYDIFAVTRAFQSDRNAVYSPEKIRTITGMLERVVRGLGGETE